MRRHLLGLIAILFLAAGVVLRLSSDADYSWVCLRVGMVLAAMWLALPQVIATFSKIPAWLIGLAVVALIAVAFTKNFLIVVLLAGGIALLKFIGYIFKPLPPRKRRAPPLPPREGS